MCEIDAEYCNLPTCPYCGHEEQDYFEFSRQDGYLEEVECGSCKNTYELETITTTRWTGHKIDAGDPA